MSEISDINALRCSLADWLEKLREGLPEGRFRLCLKGGLIPIEGQQGQVSTCFAMKIAWQTGLWEEWDAQRRQACVEFIQAFQQENGMFFDPWLSQMTSISLKDYLGVLLGRGRWKDLQLRHEQNIRAETRQSASTLLIVGAKPIYPMPLEVANEDDVRRYIQGLNWQNPWSAGSHVSHQLFMLTVNYQCFGQPKNYAELIDEFVSQLTRFYDASSGTWFAGNPSDTLKLNGAMKILSGLQWLDRPYHNTKTLLDFALQQPFRKDGCGFLNRLFVIQQAVKGVPSGYRQEDIRCLAAEVLETVALFRQEDGAFSFFTEHAQTTYYGAPVSRGQRVSDLHGTVMMVWAIAIALELLGNKTKDGTTYWKAHKA